MPEVSISIGGRSFDVACQAGEEQFLHAAAKMLDDEAQVLVDQVGRMPEARMLLMAGLMLADKTANLQEKLNAGGAGGSQPPAPDALMAAPSASLDAELTARLTALATLAETLADKAENTA